MSADPKPLPSTPEDIDTAMATEVLGWERCNEWGVWNMPDANDYIAPDAYTPSTDLNQVFEAKFHVLKTFTHLSIDIQTNDKGSTVVIWNWRTDCQTFLSDKCTTPEALATALCLALIAAVRGGI